MDVETTQRIEPTALASISPEIAEVLAGIAETSALLGASLHQQTAASLADLVRVMNCCYSNLIEGHNTRPRDIEAALQGYTNTENLRTRYLQQEAVAHIRVQATLDRLSLGNGLNEPASRQFITDMHRDFYKDAPTELLRVGTGAKSYIMEPGAFRAAPEQDNSVGRHLPPSSSRVVEFMEYFEKKFALSGVSKTEGMLKLALAHHRFNYIHPFPDGNGRVSRLMSHAMGLKIGIGAFGLWSVSRGLARGLNERTEYKQMMDLADSPRQGDLDGGGNLSERATHDFVLWFLRVCLDQLSFMKELFAIDTLVDRLRQLSAQLGVRAEGANILEEITARGSMPRGAASRVTGLSERTARDVVAQLSKFGIVHSATPKAPLVLLFRSEFVDTLFPQLFPAASCSKRSPREVLAEPR